MSVTPGLGAFNKDKVANVFGIQLKAKDSRKQSQTPLTSSIEKKIINTEASSLTANKTVSDFRPHNESNGLKTNKNALNPNSSSKTPELVRKSLENSAKSKSNTGLVSTPMHNERRISLHSNVNHSKSSNLVKSNESINSVSPYSPSPSSSSNILLPSKSSTEVKRNSLTPVMTTNRRASLTSKHSDILPKSSHLTQQTSARQTTEHTVVPLTSVKQSNIPKILTKTEAEIEYQKDQPLYKRQPSKTLDNLISTTNKNKNQHDYSSSSITNLKRPDIVQQHGHHTSQDVVLEDDVDPPFSPRTVTVKKNKLVTDEYELLEILGRGKFGEVKKCREKLTQHFLAAKFIQINKEQDRIEAINEIEIMKALQHPRLLQLYDAFETKGDFCLVMELISGGELFERVIDDDFILTERLCELYMMQICEGVSFMHSCNIIHLDMKPENILCVNRDGHRIKIIDFGLARKFDPTKQLKVLFGTPEFVAPEVINFDRVGFGTDMWSVGVICYVLLSGLSPFMGENDNDTYTNINRVNYDFDDESFTDISQEAKDFISKLLIKDKDKRLSARQCLAHPWLTRRPKLVSIPSDEETAEKKLSTKKLRRFVIRRRWQKAVNALLALQRMGMTL